MNFKKTLTKLHHILLFQEDKPFIRKTVRKLRQRINCYKIVTYKNLNASQMSIREYFFINARS